MIEDDIARILTIASDNDFKVSVRIMIECLQLCASHLPSVAVESLGVGRQFWCEGTASEVEIERARVACWEYLHQRGSIIYTFERESCAVRAVLCVLDADTPDDTRDVVDFFVQMLRVSLPDWDDEMFAESLTAVVRRFSEMA